MPKLILQSGRVLEVGRVYTSIWDPWRRVLPNQPFKVIDIGTMEEFIECLVSFGEERSWAEMYACLDPYFYVIQTD